MINRSLLFLSVLFLASCATAKKEECNKCTDAPAGGVASKPKVDKGTAMKAAKLTPAGMAASQAQQASKKVP